MVAFYNPERRSAVNIVPGLIGVILTMTMVLFTAIAIVRERERGNMELLIATPLTRTELMVGKVLPYVAIGLVQTGVILALGVWLFAVPVRGWLGDVFAAAILLIVANLALGLLISTTAQVAVPGHADDDLRVPAIDPAVGFHVPVRRHAEGGAMAGRGAAADPFPAPDSRRDAARGRPAGAVAGCSGAGGFHRHHDDGGDPQFRKRLD